MKREDNLSSIFLQFENSAKQLCEETQGGFCELKREYKGEEKPQNLKYCFAEIYYNLFTLKLTYTAHGIMNTVNSILGCSVRLDKSGDSPEIPLPLIADYCDFDVVTPMFLPFISNKEAMLQAFECIGGVIRILLPTLAEICNSPEQKSKILTAYFNELKYIFEIDEVKIMSDRAIYDFFTLRLTTPAFINIIKGNLGKAIKQLKKIKKPIGYEKRLLNVLSSKEYEALPDLSFLADSSKVYNDLGVTKSDFKEFGVLFASWLIITPATSAVFAVLYFVLVWLEGRGSVMLLGPIYNFPVCILFGFVTAISISYFTRFKFYKWINKRDYEKYCELDSIQNGGGADRLMKGFTAFLVAAGVIGCLLHSRWNINFLSNGFVDNTKFFSLKGNYYSYTEIEKAYYKPSRVNDFGDTLEFPSYVIKLKNGKEIDLYEYGEFDDYENELAELFSEKGVPME